MRIFYYTKILLGRSISYGNVYMIIVHAVKNNMLYEIGKYCQKITKTEGDLMDVIEVLQINGELPIEIDFQNDIKAYMKKNKIIIQKI